MLSPYPNHAHSLVGDRSRIPRGVLRGDFHLWLRVLRDLGHHEIFALHLRKSCHRFWDIPLAKPISKKKDIFESLKDPSRAPKPQVFFFHKQKILWFWVETVPNEVDHPSSEAKGKSCHGEISLSFARKKRR